MRAPLVALAALLLVTALPAQSARVALVAEEDGRHTTVHTNVTRSTRLIPDRVTFHLLIEGTAEQPPGALVNAEEKVTKIAALLTAAGAVLDPAAPLSVSAAPQNGGYPPPATPARFVARYTVRVTMRDAKKVASTIAIALEAGATNNSAPQFESTQADSVRRVLAAEAIAAAQVDAASLAAAIGARLGPLVSTNFQNSGQRGYEGHINFMPQYNHGGSMPPPEVIVTATVGVTFRLMR
jgi:uncharacterized protein YggE